MSAPPYPVHDAPYPPSFYPYGQQQQQDTSALPVTQVELHIACKDLLDLDVFSKSDPMAVMYLQARETKKWKEYGRTETIENNLNPEFTKSFVIDYRFEEIQKLRFEVYDIDSNSTNLSDHDLIGYVECNLGCILGINSGKFEEKLNNTNSKYEKCGSIIINAEEVNTCKDTVILHMSGRHLDKKDFFGKSDPFIMISRCNEDNSYTVVHRTEVKERTLKPNWLPFQIPARILCNGDYDRTLKFECFDWNKNGSHSLIGEFKTSVRELEAYQSKQSSFELINPKYKAKKKSYKNSGFINIIECKIVRKCTFLDYIRGGTELNFVVAVDFTASNGVPSNPSSLHYVNPYAPSQYVQALLAVGKVIEDYDTDRLFPAFGFGAKIPPTFNISHEFPLNQNRMSPMCAGVDGIIAAYYNSIQICTLSGPTNFSPVINSTARIAADRMEANPGATYFVLLIITDGVITDMGQTKQAIISASALPMSIIIVGVGRADFHEMEELDGDDVKLSHRDKYAERDIVQFVPFQDYLEKDGKYNESSGERLARDVLAELPGQLEEFMEKNKISHRDVVI